MARPRKTIAAIKGEEGGRMRFDGPVTFQRMAADYAPARRDYEATVTLVEPPTCDGAAREALEAALDAAVSWSHDRRGWSEAERVYATDYTISWAEKARR